jgi:hypothetical protein
MSSRFDYVEFDAVACAQQAQIKTKCLELEAMIAGVAQGRATAVALTKLEECYAWCGKAVRDEQVSKRGAALQEQRGNG